MISPKKIAALAIAYTSPHIPGYRPWRGCPVDLVHCFRSTLMVMDAIHLPVLVKAFLPPFLYSILVR